MNITFNKAVKIIEDYYGKDNVIQVRKPDHKNFYIADLADATVHLRRDDLLKMAEQSDIKYRLAEYITELEQKQEYYAQYDTEEMNVMWQVTNDIIEKLKEIAQ